MEGLEGGDALLEVDDEESGDGVELGEGHGSGFVFGLEVEAELDAEGGDAGEEEDEREGIGRGEVGGAEEEEADDEVEERPEGVDEGGGEAFAGRLGEGGWGRGRPEMPWTRWGMRLARKAPAKKAAR